MIGKRGSVLLVVALAMSPGALAQPTTACELYEMAVAGAATGMNDLRGEALPGASNVFAAAHRLSGYSCMVVAGERPMFACIAASRPEELARKSFEREAARIQACFADWAPSTLEDVDSPIVAQETLFLERRGDGGLYKVGTVLGWHDRDGKKEWGVGIAIAWIGDPLGV